MVKICPVCQKQFADKAAMKMHLSSVHPTWGKPRENAASKPRRKRTRRVGPVSALGRAPASSTGAVKTRVVTGIDVVGITEVEAPGVLGQFILEVQLNPRMFSETRLAAESLLWTRWRPRMFKIEIVSSAGTFVTGSYVAGWTADPRQTIPRGADAVRVVTTMANSRQAHISQALVLSIPSEAAQRWYMMGGDIDDSDHGQIFCVLSAPIANLKGSIVLSVRLHWDVEFSGPSLPGVAVQENKIYADPSYVPYFTDSVNDWASGKRLTFKEREGGNAVPFIGIDDGVVYQSTIKIGYYDANGVLKDGLLYGARIKGYYMAAMALFEKKADASEFAKDSTKTDKVLPYHSAGPYVYGNPPWISQVQVAALSIKRQCVSPNVLVDHVPENSSQAEVRSLTEKVDRLTLLVERLIEGDGTPFEAVEEVRGNDQGGESS